MKFKHIEAGVQVVLLYGNLKGMVLMVAEIDHQAKVLYFDTPYGRKFLYKSDRHLYWDVYEEPKEAFRLGKNDYENLLDMALAKNDKVWFHEIHAAMQKLGVKI